MTVSLVSSLLLICSRSGSGLFTFGWNSINHSVLLRRTFVIVWFIVYKYIDFSSRNQHHNATNNFVHYMAKNYRILKYQNTCLDLRSACVNRCNLFVYLFISMALCRSSARKRKKQFWIIANLSFYHVIASIHTQCDEAGIGEFSPFSDGRLSPSLLKLYSSGWSLSFSSQSFPGKKLSVLRLKNFV